MRPSPRTALRRRRQPSSQPRWASRRIAKLTSEQVSRSSRRTCLLAMFNALQPGVFALSGWDLCGMLTLDRRQVGGLLADGDTRWIHRAAYDLMDYRPHAHESLSKMPRGISLYGSLPAQLQDSSSFARRLAEILAVRKRYGIASSVQLDVPQVSNKAMLVMVHQLSDAEQVTVLNFSAHPISGSVTPSTWCQAASWSTCSPIRRSVRSTTCTLSRSPRTPRGQVAIGAVSR